MKSFLFGAFLGIAFLVGGMNAEAYGVLSENVVRLDESRVLYTMTYEFGFLNAELYMPMTMVREGRGGNASTSPIYRLVDAEGNIFDEGIAQAVVVSTTAARDAEYYAPHGKKAFFTLLAIVDMPRKTGETVHLEIDSVPLTIIRKGKQRELMLLTKEKLEGFKTTGISL